MMRVRSCIRPVAIALAALAVAACAGPARVDDALTTRGEPATEFSADDERITLTARFEGGRPSGRYTVEWLFPDGRVYLRKPVSADASGITTAIPVRGKAPSRNPGTWRVRLSRDGDPVVDRTFVIREAAARESPGQSFAGLAHCGPSRWNDPVISARQASAGASPGMPGAWIGGEVLAAAGATYSTVVLLTGCAPG